MILTALGIDIMLPAFPEVRIHFGLTPDSNETARLISFFFLGQVFQIVFGVLSDRLGRLPVLRLGFVVYIFFGILTVFSPSIQWMYLFRFLTGIGASAVFMSTIAGIRDRFEGDQMARILSLIFTVFLFTPVIAPFLGIGILRSFHSWKMVFLTPPLFASGIFIWSFRLKESLPAERRIKEDLQGISLRIKGILWNTTFMRYTLITSMLFTGLSTYVATSEHIVGNIYGKPSLFGGLFATTGLLMALASLSNSWFSVRFGAKKSMQGMLLLYTLVALTLLIFYLTSHQTPSLPLFFICISILLSLNLAIEPNSSALALRPMGEVAGIASALYGTIFFFTGSVFSNFLIDTLTENVFALVVAFLAIGVAAILLAFTDKSTNV
jgi:DHA1 family bicyclomycin/chloramphenicol resistance-like MFS transporter